MSWTIREHVRFRDCDAKSVMVGYDYAVGASAPLTDDQRRRLKTE
jgi:hypothetical protein